MKKILYLGCNYEDTDIQISNLARLNSTVNHGLISDKNFRPVHEGLYHTSIIDLTFAEILEISNWFDEIIMLDQDLSVWGNSKPLLTTYKLMCELELKGKQVDFRNNKNVQGFIFFQKLFKENKSFCLYPWINYVQEGSNLSLCSRTPFQVTSVEKAADWINNPEYNLIRDNMLNGIAMPKSCQVCYDYEAKNIESYRIFESMDWVARLNLKNLDDVKKIKKPYYYEMRVNNKCNLMCRGCEPKFSHLIEKESKKFDIKYPFTRLEYADLKNIKIQDLEPASRVYLTGGDPTVIPEIHKFIEECVKQYKTDFELTLCTNAAKLTKKFIDVCRNFSNLHFSISLDGYGRINDYWRWGSDWNTVVSNMKILQQEGHRISINTVPGIYNVTNLHLLYEFLDQEFPGINVYLQMNYNDRQNMWNYPESDLVVKSMKKVQKTNTYHADGKSNKSTIDSCLEYYSNCPKFNKSLLQNFFDFNDKIDQIRGSKLADYIPELEACRKYLT
jgi:sulfatase maturation enzyme AslB (radical SAM superfamily)